MLIQASNSGIFVKKNQLWAMLLLYPDPSCWTYSQQLVRVPDLAGQVYPGDPLDFDGPDRDLWLKGLPTKQQLNPMLMHPVRISETTTRADIEDYIRRTFGTLELARLDQALSRPDSAHLVSVLTRGTGRISLDRVRSRDLADLVGSVRERIRPIRMIQGREDLGDLPIPESIDIGPGATDRASSVDIGGNCCVDQNNPANAAGSLDTLEIWMAACSSDVQMGTVYVESGTTLSSTDYHDLGTVSAGSKQTASPVDVDVSENDMLGVSSDAGANNIERDSSGDGYYYEYSCQFPLSSREFDYDVGSRTVSLYGTGTEAAAAFVGSRGFIIG